MASLDRLLTEKGSLESLVNLVEKQACMSAAHSTGVPVLSLKLGKCARAVPSLLRLFHRSVFAP